MSTPDFEAMALEWLVRATGHVPAGREQSLAVELRKAYDLGTVAKTAETTRLIVDLGRVLECETLHGAHDIAQEALDAVGK